LRAQREARRTGSRPMVDRGPGYEKMMRGEFTPWTRSNA
jgi:hypothetical protein